MPLYISKYCNGFTSNIKVNGQRDTQIDLNISTSMLSINGIEKMFLSGAYNMMYLGKNILLVFVLDLSFRSGVVILNIEDIQNIYVINSFNLVNIHPEIEIWEFYIRKDMFYWFGYERKFIQTEEMELDITNKISELYDRMDVHPYPELFDEIEFLNETYYPNEAYSQSLDEIKKDAYLWKLVPKKQISFKIF